MVLEISSILILCIKNIGVMCRDIERDWNLIFLNLVKFKMRIPLDVEIRKVGNSK